MKCRVFADRMFPIVVVVMTICASTVLTDSSAMAETGIASVYAYSGGKTASGERANPGGFTAAHRTLKFGTQVRVTNRRNARLLTFPYRSGTAGRDENRAFYPARLGRRCFCHGCHGKEREKRRSDNGDGHLSHSLNIGRRLINGIEKSACLSASDLQQPAR